MSWNTPQHKAARASGVARHERAQLRKERAARIAAAPPCGFCHDNKSAPGVLIGDDSKPICTPCLKGRVPWKN